MGQEIEETALASIQAMMDEEAELISIYYGEQVEEEKAQELLAAVEEQYPDCDVELNDGGQPIYYYVLSIE